jgi:tetratricopeptide (TPR) repeat protein
MEEIHQHQSNVGQELKIRNMKKKISTFFLLVLIAFFGWQISNAQSAVAICPGTTQYSVAKGATNEAQAREAALDKCREDCNVDPKILTSTNQSGYGCIYFGVNKDGIIYIGAALGCSNSYEAERKAKDALPSGMETTSKEYAFWDEGGVKESAYVQPTPQWSYDEQKAIDYSQSKDFNSVLTYAKLALEKKYTHDITMLYGYAFLMLEKNQEAWNVFDTEIREKNTTDPMSFYYRADMAAKLEHYDAAIQDYNTAISKGVEGKLIYKSLGYSFYCLNNFDAAIQNFDIYIQSNQTDFQAYHLRGLAYFEKNDSVKAKSDLTKAIELGSTIPETYIKRGRIYLTQNQYTDAENDLTKATTLDSENPSAWFFLGFAQACNNKLQTSLDAFSTCIKLNPKIPDAWLYRGYAKWLLNNKVDAESDFSKALQLNPEYKETISGFKGN